MFICTSLKLINNHYIIWLTCYAYCSDILQTVLRSWNSCSNELHINSHINKEKKIGKSQPAVHYTCCCRLLRSRLWWFSSINWGRRSRLWGQGSGGRDISIATAPTSRESISQNRSFVAVSICSSCFLFNQTIWKSIEVTRM